METSNQTDLIEARKEKIKNILKGSHRLALVGIIILAILIRFYFFVLTSNQPLWWDEAAYGTLAKNSISGKWDGTFVIDKESFIRPPLLPLLWSILLRIGFGEVGVRFLLQFVPSAFSIYFIYIIGRDYYNRNVGLAASFIFSVLWIHLFYTSRILTTVPSLALMFPSFYYFMKSQKGEFNGKYFGISIFLAALATLMRYPNGIVLVVFLAFLILTFRTDLIKNKKFWIFGIMGAIPIILFFGFNYLDSGNIFPQLLGGTYVGKDTGQPKPPIAFNQLNFIPQYLQTSFFILFLLGLVVALFETGVGYDLISKKQRLKSHLLLLLFLVLFFSFFIFYTRAAEDRYFLPVALTFALFSGLGANVAYNFIKKHNKQVAIFIILTIFAFGGYQQLKFADSLIENRMSSFLQVKQGLEWLKSNAPADSVVLANGITVYTTYYGEFNYLEPTSDGFGEDEYGELVYLGEESVLDENKFEPDFFIVQAFKPPQPYIPEYLERNKDKWGVMNAFFFDEQQQQPAFVIYQRIDQKVQEDKMEQLVQDIE
jgi:4-amino-4-deoxy-L-arabinose transferase-like glycosyltransferase